AAIPGVKVANGLHAARQAERPGDLPPAKFRALLIEKMEQLGIDPSFMGRYLNDGFSGGEKKRIEMLQLAVLAPKYAILDETDSGLDIDALKDVGSSIAALRASEEGRNTGFLIITHYPRILSYVVPDVVHVMIDGRIVKTGGHDLAHRIEREGYDKLREESAVVA
ncbi:MAG: ABC transporter ATP-binding protein, partial [Candidatus Cybelea sp.]